MAFQETLLDLSDSAAVSFPDLHLPHFRKMKRRYRLEWVRQSLQHKGYKISAFICGTLNSNRERGMDSTWIVCCGLYKALIVVLENQVGEQDHAAANIWRIQVGKLATQQIGDGSQLQENEFNIAIYYYAQNKTKTNVELRAIYLGFKPLYIGKSHTNECPISSS